MTRLNLKDRIAQGQFLLDGAMGTELFARGIKAGLCNDYLNLESAQVVLDVQSSYIQAGSDAVITNTFGANKYTLARHGYGELVEKINTQAARTARKAAGNDKYVLGDIGPAGDFLEPLGALKPAELKTAFAEQAKCLLEAGVDGFIIETMTALDELAIAIEAVKSISGDLPVFASMSFDVAGDSFRTMMGVDVRSLVEKAASLGADAVGFNCGTASLENYIKLAKEFVAAAGSIDSEIALLAEPNAGLPEIIDGSAVYKVTPDDFATAVEKIHALDINIIGGCCGTSPAHIREVSRKLKKSV